MRQKLLILTRICFPSFLRHTNACSSKRDRFALARNRTKRLPAIPKLFLCRELPLYVCKIHSVPPLILAFRLTEWRFFAKIPISRPYCSPPNYSRDPPHSVITTPCRVVWLQPTVVPVQPFFVTFCSTKYRNFLSNLSFWRPYFTPLFPFQVPP